MKNNEIKRSFWEITKRFFEPVKYNKKITIRAIFKMILSWIEPIIHILFIQKIVYIIEKWNYDNFKIIFLYYIIFIIIFEIIQYIIKYWWWFQTVESFRKTIYWKYISKYILLNNTDLEKTWTWKTISIVEKWIETWALILDEFIRQAPI
jgi:hypothetical protein